jgi:ATP-dependent DNA helicase RecQ
MIKKAESILNNIFGYSEFRSLQKEIIQNVLARRDTLVIMPTGGGKSLCYQIPALIFDGLTIVVSPLISLMKDQVEQLKELGIDAVFLNSSLSAKEYNLNVDKIKANHAKMLYVAPETLLMERTINLLSKIKIDCITIDEAHCISEWGHDFRQEYRKLASIQPHFPSAVMIALTATATPHVQDDIVKSLKLKSSKKFIASFNRQNLYLQIMPKNDPFSQTLEFLEKHPNQSGIIYCFSRKQVDELCEDLQNKGYSVKPYHAGLSDEERKKNQEMFIKDDVLIIVATIAFGMGINKPNVRFVIHYDLPGNIESYYQQIGRAGRDGLMANCLLLFGYGDIRKINYFIDQKEDKERRIAKAHLESLIRFAEDYRCRRIPLLNYFGEKYNKENCGMCDNCNREAKDLTDVTIEAQKFLSCIKRTGEFFGAMHIVDVLLGSKNQKVVAKNHHHLSTYGIGSDLSKKHWLNLSRQFIQKNLITKDMEFGSLKITDVGYEVLKGNRTVTGKLEADVVKFIPKPEMDLDYDENLFDLLKEKRKILADRSYIPPYVVFPDKTLIEMAAYYPQSENEMLKIHGVGRIKFNKFGVNFLILIKRYCKKKNITKKFDKPGRRRGERTHSKKPRKFQKIGDEYISGKSVTEIMDEFDLKIETLLRNLKKYNDETRIVDPKRLLPFVETEKKYQSAVLKLFGRFGTEYLKTVYDAMNETVSYKDLHILRLYYEWKNK